MNPILNSFQKTFHNYHIQYELIELFFHSMEMDLKSTAYDTDTYEKYILGSAEVVGLMCLHVFTEKNREIRRIEAIRDEAGFRFSKG